MFILFICSTFFLLFASCPLASFLEYFNSPFPLLTSCLYSHSNLPQYCSPINISTVDPTQYFM